MKWLNVIICFLLISSISVIITLAADNAPAYSLGTMQPKKVYYSNPGKDVNVTFYIFNAYGNRISHITLAVTDNPDNMQVTLPPLQTNKYLISGIETDIQEHLFVCNMSIVETQPTVPLKDNFCYKEPTYYLRSTNVSGYIPAKAVTVGIKIPSDAKLGTQYTLTIMANANWYGELGTSQVSQSRPFQYTFVMVAENYSEELITPETGGEFGISNEMLFGIVIGVLVIVILFQQFRPKKHR
jgi:hypothetical protein